MSVSLFKLSPKIRDCDETELCIFPLFLPTPKKSGTQNVAWNKKLK